MSALRFNRVVLLESLGSADLKTGRSLSEDLPYIGMEYDLPIPIEFHSINSKRELLDQLDELTVRAQCSEVYPVLQIDAHGSDAPPGLVMNSGELVKWYEVETLLRRLNLATRCNLFLVSATCFGLFANLTVAIANRAPFWAVVGPIGEISAGDVADALRRFYRALFAQVAPTEIVDSLQGSQLRVITAEWFFVQSYKYLVQKLDPSVPGSTEEFDNFLEHFFMTDIYPENHVKYSVTFEKIRL